MLKLINSKRLFTDCAIWVYRYWWLLKILVVQQQKISFAAVSDFWIPTCAWMAASGFFPYPPQGFLPPYPYNMYSNMPLPQGQYAEHTRGSTMFPGFPNLDFPPAPPMGIHHFQNPAAESVYGPAAESDLGCPSKKTKNRRIRISYSRQQLAAMEELFEETRYPDIYQREALSEKIGVPQSKILVWFKNHRAKVRKTEGPTPSAKVRASNVADFNSHDTDSRDSLGSRTSGTSLSGSSDMTSTTAFSPFLPPSVSPVEYASMEKSNIFSKGLMPIPMPYSDPESVKCEVPSPLHVLDIAPACTQIPPNVNTYLETGVSTYAEL